MARVGRNGRLRLLIRKSKEEGEGKGEGREADSCLAKRLKTSGLNASNRTNARAQVRAAAARIKVGDNTLWLLLRLIV